MKGTRKKNSLNPLANFLNLILPIVFTTTRNISNQLSLVFFCFQNAGQRSCQTFHFSDIPLLRHHHLRCLTSEPKVCSQVHLSVIPIVRQPSRQTCLTTEPKNDFLSRCQTSHLSDIPLVRHQYFLHSISRYKEIYINKELIIT